MNCYVYKGHRKPDYFLYLDRVIDQEQSDSQLPPSIMQLLGELSLVLEFELTADRHLAQADPQQVLLDIETQGFYLQMPKKDLQAEEDALFN